jgi:arginyl-tRNA--protein-N-Asp/Glu arginylyltransferase
MLSLDAKSYNAYIMNTIEFVEDDFIIELINQMCDNKRIIKQIKAIEKRYKKAKAINNKYPSKDANVLGLYISLYAFFRFINKDEILEFDLKYYEQLQTQVENNEKTEEQYRQVGQAIITTNQITSYFEHIGTKDIDCKFEDDLIVIDVLL